MKGVRRIFAAAGIYGLLLLVPYYFLEDRIGRDYPPAVTHPEFFYGFVGLAIVWQIAFLLIAREPLRLRPMMIAAVLEKWTFAAAVVVLYAKRRVPNAVAAFAGVDFALGCAFVWAYLRSGKVPAE